MSRVQRVAVLLLRHIAPCRAAFGLRDPVSPRAAARATALRCWVLGAGLGAKCAVVRRVFLLLLRHVVLCRAARCRAMFVSLRAATCSAALRRAVPCCTVPRCAVACCTPPRCAVRCPPALCRVACCTATRAVRRRAVPVLAECRIVPLNTLHAEWRLTWRVRQREDEYAIRVTMWGAHEQSHSMATPFNLLLLAGWLSITEAGKGGRPPGPVLKLQCTALKLNPLLTSGRAPLRARRSLLWPPHFLAGLLPL
jgi:hypothetical protein